MAVYSWKSAVSGSWNTPSNWTPSGGPQLNPGLSSFLAGSTGATTDTANFTTGSNKAYVVNGTARAYTLNISDSVTFNNFSLSNGFEGVRVNLNAGANASIGTGSALKLTGYFYSGTDGSLNVAARSVLNDYGSVSGGFLNVAGTLNVSGRSATVSGINNHDQPFGGTLSKGGIINVTNGGSLTNSFFAMDGTINISGAASTYSMTGVSWFPHTAVATDGRINGSNGAVLSVSGAVANNGLITAQSGKFDITGQVVSGSSGAGSFQVDRGATLELGGSSNENVAFLSNAILQLDKGVAETGFLQNFSTGDAIDLSGTTLTGLKAIASAGITTLTAFAGTAAVDTFRLNGNYGLGNFQAHADGHGGTLISYVPPSTHTVAPILHA